MRPQAEVADVLRLLGKEVEKIGLNPWQLRTLSAIRRCRTAALGGHVDACDACGTVHISYNSCRNRHCPKCQGHKREAWMQARRTELLPVPYFHVVFTLPDALDHLALSKPRDIYGMLFDTAWSTLRTFSKAQGVRMGMIAILHTWGQNLSLHPHLHCIVPGGGIGAHGKWRNIRKDGKFLYPVKALSKVFRAKFCAALREKGLGSKSLMDPLFARPWVVYAKRPFGGPKQVIEYLGRYTHKIAISNHRLLCVENQGVSFSYKDYRQGGQQKIMILPPVEFVRRFAQHILPKGFVRIRHYGILSSCWKPEKLPQLQAMLQVRPSEAPASEGTMLHRCPSCREGVLRTILYFGERGPPSWAHGGAANISSCNE
jgi:hypothetical protein